jgi:hypothetical protein
MPTRELFPLTDGIVISVPITAPFTLTLYLQEAALAEAFQ